MAKTPEEIIASFPQSLIDGIRDGGEIQVRFHDGGEITIMIGGSEPNDIPKAIGADENWHQDQSLVKAAVKSLDGAVERGEVRRYSAVSKTTGTETLSYRLP